MVLHLRDCAGGVAFAGGAVGHWASEDGTVGEGVTQLGERVVLDTLGLQCELDVLPRDAVPLGDAPELVLLHDTLADDDDSCRHHPRDPVVPHEIAHAEEAEQLAELTRAVRTGEGRQELAVNPLADGLVEVL